MFGLFKKKQPDFRIYLDDSFKSYSLGDEHPFSWRRYDAFLAAFEASGIASRAQCHPAEAVDESLLTLFHDPEYVAMVKQRSAEGEGYLDGGDTPAFHGVYEASLFPVGAVVSAARDMMEKRCKRVFVPLAGLHHSYRDHTSGFCVFNDMAVAAELLMRDYGLTRIAYVDIDAHHGDGVYYGFEDDPRIIFADIHQNGKTVFPGTGFAYENGRGAGQGLKLNIELSPGSCDRRFYQAWEQVEALLVAQRPEFIFFQAGADGLAGDPLAELQFSEMAHHHAASRLRSLANEFGHGRVLAMGGGGYNLKNIEQAWMAVVETLA